MAAPSLTYTLTNGTTADASQVMQNFNDLLNGITDGSKDLSISALTCAGTATLNGHVTLGNSSADDLTVTASLASNLVPKTDATYSLGSAALGFTGIYLSNGGGLTARVVSAAHAADREYTIPDCGAAASFMMTQLAQTVTGVKTFNDGIVLDDAAGQDTLNYYAEDANTVTVTNGASGANEVTTASAPNVTLTTVRVGKAVTFRVSAVTASMVKSSAAGLVVVPALFPAGFRPGSTHVFSFIAKVSSTYAVRAFTVNTSGDLSMYGDAALGNITGGATGIGWDVTISGSFYVSS